MISLSWNICVFILWSVAAPFHHLYLFTIWTFEKWCICWEFWYSCGTFSCFSYCSYGRMPNSLVPKFEVLHLMGKFWRKIRFWWWCRCWCDRRLCWYWCYWGCYQLCWHSCRVCLYWCQFSAMVVANHLINDLGVKGCRPWIRSLLIQFNIIFLSLDGCVCCYLAVLYSFEMSIDSSDNVMVCLCRYQHLICCHPLIIVRSSHSNWFYLSFIVVKECYFPITISITGMNKWEVSRDVTLMIMIGW